MSDDPASIEAWQEQEKSDIVARLRVINHHTKKLAENESLHDLYRDAFTRCENLTWEAANEIERLRKRLLAEENAYDIMRRENEHLQTDRNNLALEIERLRKRLRQENATLTKERDEATTKVNLYKKEHDALRAERDDVRQSYCSLMEAYRGGDGRVTANKLGWGYLFEEDKPCQ